NLTLDQKARVLAKVEDPYAHHSDREKIVSWARQILELPFGQIKSLPVNRRSEPAAINNFLLRARNILDKTVYGMEAVKEDIIDFLTKFIVCPNSKGTVLGLHGSPGVGKCFAKNTKIL